MVIIPVLYNNNHPILIVTLLTVSPGGNTHLPRNYYLARGKHPLSVHPQSRRGKHPPHRVVAAGLRSLPNSLPGGFLDEI